MATKFDINVKQHKKIPFEGLQSSKLTLEFSGKDINTVITNTLIRVALDDIPTYAFPEDGMIMEYNDSIFNNDYMRQHLAQLPIFNIENELFYLAPKYYQDVNYANLKREKHPKEKNIEIVVSSHNDTLDEMNVTSNHIKFIQDGTEIKDKYDKDNPVLLIQLKPNQTFKCVLRATLGIGEKSDIWSAASNAFHDDQTIPDKILLTLASQGQMDEYEILVKACKYVKFKLGLLEEDIKKRIQEKKIKDTHDILIDLENEDHTIGQLITDGLQDHRDVIYAGMAKPDHLVRRILIKVVISETVKNPINVLFDTFNKLVKLFDHLEATFWKLGNKYIKLPKDLAPNSTNKDSEVSSESKKDKEYKEDEESDEIIIKPKTKTKKRKT